MSTPRAPFWRTLAWREVWVGDVFSEAGPEAGAAKNGGDAKER